MQVIVIFTVFSGLDSQELLLPLANEYKMSVYLGLPSLSLRTHQNLPYRDAYIEFVTRFVQNYEENLTADIYLSGHDNESALTGYFWSEDFSLAGDIELPADVFFPMLKQMAQIIHGFNKLIGISTTVSTNTKLPHLKLEDYSEAMINLASQADVDVISVKDGIGSGLTAAFWQTQLGEMIQTSDVRLFNILRAEFPYISENVTYEDIFFASAEEVLRH